MTKFIYQRILVLSLHALADLTSSHTRDIHKIVINFSINVY
jgi:hypothetical protein